MRHVRSLTVLLAEVQVANVMPHGGTVSQVCLLL